MGNRLAITDDGKLCVNDYRSIYKAILVELCKGPKSILDLVISIRKTYIEFKYIKDNIIVGAIGELMKCRLVVSTYKDE